jgi:hypothetical protein
MKKEDQEKKEPISITRIRKATEEELTALAALGPPRKGQPLFETTVGISHLPEMRGSARAFFPTHDFEVIKKYRESLYDTFIRPEFFRERTIKDLETTEKDFKDLRTDWLNDELKEIERISIIPQLSRSDFMELRKYRNYVISELNTNKEVIEKEKPLKRLANITTKAKPEEIMDFWLKLQGNNEKGEPYWNDKEEIKHFVNQNFGEFSEADELKEFNPNMNKSELYHVTWTFFKIYGEPKTKKQYERLLLQNFTKFKGGSHVYSNIKDQNNEHLKRLLK